ncbi:unnamed protein product [Leuciscus chuanchicus]
MRSGFYSPYFIVPKKTGDLRPILDLHRLLFKMVTAKRILECVRPQGWFAAIDLKDAYFHVSILPRRFAFERRAYQYTVLPFGLALSPRIFKKVVKAALVPLRCFRTSDQLFVCYGGKLKGKALSKQSLSHWIVDSIALAYQQQGRPCPFGVKAHSTRSHPAALTNLGAILHLNGKLKEAESNYLHALQLKPDDLITQSNLHKLWNVMQKQGLRAAGT